MIKNGDPAFPHEHHKGCIHCHHGMSLRDYFACHIMETLITPGLAPNATTAEKSYQWATLMIDARTKEY